MANLAYILPALACPVGMGVMMWLMMRPAKNQSDAPADMKARDQELARLRNEIDALREHQRSGYPDPSVDLSKPSAAP